MKTISTILLSVLLSVTAFAANVELDQDSGVEVLVYPNPTVDKVKIKGCENIQGIKVYNLTGKVVLEREEACEISLKELPEGIYIFKINTGEDKVTKRIIKKP